ncbi:MAG: SAM-dependent methyltransferase [Firmicutes bacterium]|nr:SAM-dependent methyltransferase [Bacillota bacterium]
MDQNNQIKDNSKKDNSKKYPALSQRLLAAAKMLSADIKSAADIGTDHALLPVYLVQKGMIKSAVAADIAPLPLARAKKTVSEYYLESAIALRQGSGLLPLSPGETEAAFICGMGGITVMEILSEGKAIADSLSELILQPQRDVPRLRAFLHENGFFIAEESMVFEGGHFYNIIKALHGKEEAYSEREYLLGRRLIEKKDPVLAQYISQRREKLQSLIKELEGKMSDSAKSGLFAAKKELELLWE